MIPTNHPAWHHQWGPVNQRMCVYILVSDFEMLFSPKYFTTASCEQSCMNKHCFLVNNSVDGSTSEATKYALTCAKPPLQPLNVYLFLFISAWERTDENLLTNTKTCLKICGLNHKLFGNQVELWPWAECYRFSLPRNLACYFITA